MAERTWRRAAAQVEEGLRSGTGDELPRSVGRLPHLALRLAHLWSARCADLLFLGLIVAIATAVYLDYALRVATFQLDENLYTHEARYLAAHFPEALWQLGDLTRGASSDLDALLLAIPVHFHCADPARSSSTALIQCLLVREHGRARLPARREPPD